MKYIVYCTRNNKNSKIYIGVHKTINPFKFDGYLGNGIYTYNKTIELTTAFRKAVNKYGVDNFIRVVLGVFDNEEDAYNLEALIVTKEFIKRPDVYNIVVGGKRANFSSCLEPVVQYDLDGKLLKIFTSFTEAAEEISTDPWKIIKACQEENITCNGYYWRKTSDNIRQKITTSFDVKDLIRSVPVVQYSKAGYKVKVWSSIVEASRSLNCDKSSISSSCKGEPHRKICGGYQWRYLSDNLESVEAANTTGGVPKKIVKLSKEGVLLDSYDSIEEAQQKSEVSKVSIHKGLKHGKLVMGFKWEYV